VIAWDAALARIGVTADATACIIVIEARLLPHAARAGARVDIEPGPDSVRFAWRLPSGGSGRHAAFTAAPAKVRAR
jgi:hypothetical protein